MKQIDYLRMKREQRRAFLLMQWKKSGRGNAGAHKTNHLCPRCGKVFNTQEMCPVHKVDLVRYIGDPPRVGSRKHKKLISLLTNR